MNLTKIIEMFLYANLDLIAIHQFSILPGSKVTRQRTKNQACGIVIPISGSARYIIEGKEYVIRPGNILFAGSDLLLDKEVLGDQNWEYYLVHYLLLENQITDHPLSTLHFSLSFETGHEAMIFQNVIKMENALRDETCLGKMKERTYFMEFLTFLLEKSGMNHILDDEERIEQSIEFMEMTYYKNFCIRDFADKVYLDERKYSYLFQRKTGMSPKQYLVSLRLQKARELLEGTSYPVHQVSEMVGYEDAFHFSRLFKKYYGNPPLYYHKKMGKNT